MIIPKHSCRASPLLLLGAALAFARPAAAETYRVFLLAGQSNMEGVGAAAQAPTNLLGQSSVWLYHSPSVRSALPPGRWNPLAKAWLTDDTTSPCIDAGDPALEVLSEPAPHGSRINLGAYGATAEASKSP